jgi:uncharacterized protein
MNYKEILNATEEYVKKTLEGDSSGHDWWHIYRVNKMANYIGKKEGANLFIVGSAALLHDIADWKFHNGNCEIGPATAQIWLEKMQVDSDTTSHICSIIKDISFKGAGVQSKMGTLEGQVVQDADRLDAIGAIGIARTFAYGGYKKHEIYNPDIKPVLHTSFEAYKNSNASVINHSYEKLLLLKDLMNTRTGWKIAKERHKFMERFLRRFFKEWKGQA